ncbi:outer membrane beta-barrel protein [Fulvivirgaceae bacterium PWU5]|uniref:Outer membrane beta-barrel protein n=1 Tax=Dawidia cretensis TaxID=2782350 RepID=A0AAP2DWN5_9BACT|nr:porin family protein [Dawidia cretensis]MBT1708651.1 outer membrane beta-barrel protein [Dawidia cretensis]
MLRYSLFVSLIVFGTVVSTLAQRIVVQPKMGVTLSTITNHAGVFDVRPGYYNPTPIAGVLMPHSAAPTPGTPYGYITGTSYSGMPPTQLGLEIPTLDNTAFQEVPRQETKVKTGFTIGVAVNIAFSERFSLQPELSYIRKGAQTHYSTNSIQSNPESSSETVSQSWGDGKVTLEYLELPILARYNFPSQSKIITFFVVAGPAFSMGVGGQVRSDAGYSYYTRATDYTLVGPWNIGEGTSTRRGSVEFEDGIFSKNGQDLPINKKYDVGAQIGGGVTLIKYLVIDVRYSRGFVSVYDRYSNARNQTLQVSLGVPLIF